MDATKDINIAVSEVYNSGLINFILCSTCLIYFYLLYQHIEIELKLLRKLINEGCSLVSKEYAILDFKFEYKCAAQLMWQHNVMTEYFSHS